MARKKHEESDDNAAPQSGGEAPSPDGPLPLVKPEPLPPGTLGASGEDQINPYQSFTTGDSGVPLLQTAQVVASAVAREPGVGAKVAPARQYRVVGTMQATVNGQRVMMRYGKIVDEKNYDITSLRRQGVPLEEIPPEQPQQTAG